MKKEFLIVWSLLVLATLISGLVAVYKISFAVEIILQLAALKFIGVAFYFMKIKKANPFWKVAIVSFVVLFTVINILIL
jgi:hypothetical protein